MSLEKPIFRMTWRVPRDDINEVVDTNLHTAHCDSREARDWLARIIVHMYPKALIYFW